MSASKFYHYTAIENARGIMEDGYIDIGFRFVRLGIKGLPERAHQGVVFGLPDNPLPLGWCGTQWGDHGGKMGMPVLESVFHYKTGAEFILFEVTPDARQEGLFVTDYGVHLPDDYKGNSYADDPGTLRAKWDYYNRLVPWEEYQTCKGELQYALPEVISFKPISVSQCKPLRKMSRFELINAITEIGGYKLYPPQPQREPIDIRALLNGHRSKP